MIHLRIKNQIESIIKGRWILIHSFANHWLIRVRIKSESKWIANQAGPSPAWDMSFVGHFKGSQNKILFFWPIFLMNNKFEFVITGTAVKGHRPPMLISHEIVFTRSYKLQKCFERILVVLKFLKVFDVIFLPKPLKIGFLQVLFIPRKSLSRDKNHK